ncbi:MAG: hypothetical protein EOS75_29385 [Mesorhizobium sp.]|nr:MAG: hypothetical protein EOS75_29385 [Mesorhizobium sp.]
MGSFGAVAEFHQDEGEVAVIDEQAALTRATHRGAIPISQGLVAGIVPVDYETLSPKRLAERRAELFDCVIEGIWQLLEAALRLRKADDGAEAPAAAQKGWGLVAQTTDHSDLSEKRPTLPSAISS